MLNHYEKKKKNAIYDILNESTNYVLFVWILKFYTWWKCNVSDVEGILPDPLESLIEL